VPRLRRRLARGLDQIADEGLFQRGRAALGGQRGRRSLSSTLPACIMDMRSQRSASFMKWVEMKIVTRSRRDSSISRRQKLVARHRVHARGGLVQDQQLGLVHHGHGQRQALAHAQRQACRAGLAHSGRPKR
jgi:hypothetical protein